MFKLTFLSSSVPLTKTIRADGSKSSYPNVTNFTSIELEVNNINDFHKHLSSMSVADSKPCLLKGNLKKPLKNEARKGMMPPNVATNWVCFDLDKAPFSSPAEFMRAIKLDDVSYVVQYSSSYKLVTDKTLNCHIFILLSSPTSPQNLKAWLMYLNLNTPSLSNALTLGNSHSHLHWPLDITTCQNDKLIYTAAPIFLGRKDPVSITERVYIHAGKSPTLNISRIALQPVDALKKQANKIRDQLREAIGLTPIRHKVKVIDDYTVQPGCSEATYQIVEENEDFTRINLNGGDSNAYWFYNTDFELIRNFKGEDFMYMKEVLPDLYKQLKGETREDLFSISQVGDTIIAFRDKVTGQYWKGLWNEDKQILDIDSIDSKDKLFDFLQGHGQVPPPYVPEWRMTFEPQNPVVVDVENHTLNRFCLPQVFRTASKGQYPIIQKALDSAVGTGPIQEHFLNWLAVIFQHKRKTGTAWILHGTQGTGKGVIFSDVIVPLLTKAYTEHILATALNSDFDGWQENKLLIFIDEIEVDMFEKKSGVEAKLKKMVTEKTDDVHRKGVTRYTTNSYVNLIFGSNKSQPVKIPHNDRRYNVGQYQHNKWTPSRKEIEEDLPKELNHFLHYLLNRKACIDTARSILQTEDRDSIQALSLTSVDDLAKNILDGKLDKLMEHLPDETLLRSFNNPLASAYWEVMKDISQQLSTTNHKTKVTRDQLLIIFQYCIGKVPEGSWKFGKFLQHHGIDCKQLKDRGVKSYGIEVGWKFTDIQDFHKQFVKLPTAHLRKVK